jgi:hypothetical protein
MQIEYEGQAADENQRDSKPLLLGETSTESENVDMNALQTENVPSSRYLKLEAAKKHLDMKEPENHYRYLKQIDTDE